MFKLNLSQNKLKTPKNIFTPLGKLDRSWHHDLIDALVTIKDLEDFQEVTELMKDHLVPVMLSQVTMNSKIDQMISFLRKTTGKGHLRIVEVKENADGSTILELEILKGE